MYNLYHTTPSHYLITPTPSHSLLCGLLCLYCIVSYLTLPKLSLSLSRLYSQTTECRQFCDCCDDATLSWTRRIEIKRCSEKCMSDLSSWTICHEKRDQFIISISCWCPENLSSWFFIVKSCSCIRCDEKFVQVNFFVVLLQVLKKKLNGPFYDALLFY